MIKIRVKPKGLGDLVENLIFVTGISILVNKATNGGCGCEKRKEYLNKVFPFK